MHLLLSFASLLPFLALNLILSVSKCAQPVRSKIGTKIEMRQPKLITPSDSSAMIEVTQKLAELLGKFMFAG